MFSDYVVITLIMPITIASYLFGFFTLYQRTLIKYPVAVQHFFIAVIYLSQEIAILILMRYTNGHSAYIYAMLTILFFVLPRMKNFLTVITLLFLSWYFNQNGLVNIFVCEIVVFYILARLVERLKIPLMCKITIMTLWGNLSGMTISRLWVILIQHRTPVPFDYRRFILVITGTCVLLAIYQILLRTEIVNDNLYLTAEYNSMHDSLTGLKNFAALQSHVEKYHSDIQQAPIFLGMFDIDHFKHINDTYGHLEGNKILQYMTSLFESFQGDYGVSDKGDLYRYGGEEFALLIRDSELSEVITLINEFKQYVNRNAYTTNDGRVVHLTFSMGLVCSRKDEGLFKTIERADKLLYQAKNNGKNQIIIDEELLK